MTQHPLYDQVIQSFRGRFQAQPQLVVRAPGRVNLIGEHTDYNQGLVLPVAVDQAAWLAVSPVDERWANIRAVNMGNDDVAFSLEGVPASMGGWSDYPKGIVWAFMDRNLQPGGINAVLASDVPVGAGMSSSAAVELAFAFTWNTFSRFGLSLPELALLSQKAENQYVGVNCGIMDQMISACGKAGHAMMLDARSLERGYFPLPEGVAIVVIDSMVRRSLASSEYNVRRAQCEEAVRLLQPSLPHIQSLRDVTLADLERYGSALSDVVFRRARHVISENARVLKVAERLHAGAIETVGALMVEAHRSLRDDYEVSAPELDALVAAAVEVPGCYGARLTGAGFGGCAIALAAEDAVPALQQHVSAAYQAQFEQAPHIYVTHAANGVAAIE
ncbi:MAG TPA: galactokinase [Anaerolineae bacterium]|nr:galactokinase [Anaerolineae bacterium]